MLAQYCFVLFIITSEVRNLFHVTCFCFENFVGVHYLTAPLLLMLLDNLLNRSSFFGICLNTQFEADSLFKTNDWHWFKIACQSGNSFVSHCYLMS